MAGSSYSIPDLGGAKPTSAADKKKRLPPLPTPKAGSSKPDGASRFRELTSFAPSQEYIFQKSQKAEPVVLKAAGENTSSPSQGLRAMGSGRKAGDWGTWESSKPDEREGPEKPNPMSTGSGYRSKEKERKDAQFENAIPHGPVKMQAPRRAKQMTWEEYNALKPHERAAVDFNTLLVRAREKDLNADYDPLESQRKNYLAQATRVFGEDSAAASAYAPETVALLSELGYKAKTGEDLDDFLSMEAGISAKEMKNFAPGKLETTIFNATNDSVTGGATEHQLASRTADLQATMAKSGMILQNFNAAVKAKINSNIVAGGGTKNEITASQGYQTERKTPEAEELDSWFAQAYSGLLRKDLDETTRAGLWNEINAPLTGKERQQLIHYLDTRSRQEASAGVDWNKDDLPLGDGKSTSKQFKPGFIKPDEMRKLLGLDKREG